MKRHNRVIIRNNHRLLRKVCADIANSGTIACAMKQHFINDEPLGLI